MNLAITGGGTGGHLSIAKALAIECKNRGFEIVYIGSTSGQDRLWFENSEIFKQCYFLQTTGVVNKRGFGAINALKLQLKATFKSREILKSHNIDAVISVGGFSAGGASCASLIDRIPLFIHEQNAIKGTLNKLLSPFARAVFGTFKLDSKNFIQLPYPVNCEFFTKARVRKNIKTIIFLGGSQGAKALNDFALNVACDLKKRGIKIIHQCGKNDFERVKNEYKNLGFFVKNGESKNDKSKSEDSKSGNFAENRDSKNGESSDCGALDLFSFDTNIVDKIAAADFCVSRAGASSLWELCANGLAAYFVPYPYAAKNHQFFNAMYLKNQGLCEVKAQDELNKEDFLAYLDLIDVESVSANLIQNTQRGGAEEIVDNIVRLINA